MWRSWLARLVVAQKVAGSSPVYHPIFFARIPGKKNMKPEKALLHTAVKRCFIIRRIASYGEAVLHKTPFQMKHCSRLHFITPWQAAAAPQYEASPLCSDMKHSAFAPYDEKIKNESLLPENALILIKSPQILRCKRSPDLCRRKKIT